MAQKIYTSTSFKVLATIHNVESKLVKPISKRTFTSLFVQLEAAQKECQDQELLSRIISLYGKVIDKYVKTTVQKIALLANKPDCNTKALKKKIEEIKSYGLSKENFAILRKIEKKISDKDLPENASIVNVEIEIIEDLFHLAGLIYAEKEQKAQAAYTQIPQETKNHLSKHLKALQKTLFEDSTSTIQALFATAHELAERPLLEYPTLEEIKEFFTEESLIKKADHPNYWDLSQAN